MNAPDLMHTLAWSLLHFLWQGAALAALAAALLFVLRRPATRYLIGVGALGLMLLSFVLTFSLLSGASGHDARLTTGMGPPAGAPASPHEASTSAISTGTEARAAADSTGFLWVARAWLAGVFLLALRIALGLLVLERLRRRNLLALPEALVARLRALQGRLGISREIRYNECPLVSVPAVIGFFRPVVLIPLRALTGLTPEQLEALIAHELGHIKRFDVAVNFFQVIAETLFFFHPAVWWLNKRIRADREDCCDDIAVAAAGSSVGYARALATIAPWRDVPTFAMAATAGPVATRVARLLGLEQARGNTSGAGIFTATLVLAGALFAGALSLGLTRPAQAQTRVETAVAPQAAKASPAARPAPAAKPAPAAVPAPAARPAPAAPAVPAREPPAPRRIDAPSFIEEMRSSGLDPSLDQIVAMKVHDVTTAYVKQVRGLGFHADIDQIIAFKVHGVTPEYVQQMRANGFEMDAGEVIAMKVHGITPEYRELLENQGFKLTTDEVIQARVFGITPEFIAKARAQGFKDLEFRQLIALKHADIL